MNEPNETESSPNIIVDSDWKEQVAQEKEKLKSGDAAADADAEAPAAPSAATASGTLETSGTAEASGTAETSGAVDADDAAEASDEVASTEGTTLPPASFQVLVSMLFTQAISALGQMPSPSGEATKVDKPMAKHTIDTLEMLEQKTQGNLTEEEAKMVKEALHALRMTYVGVRG